MKILAYLIFFLLFLQLANAISYEQEFQIFGKETIANIEINFDNKQNFNFYLDLPRDTEEVTVLLDDKEEEFEVIKSSLGNVVNINGDAKQVKINYNSKSFIEQTSKNYFTAELSSLFDSELKIKIILPEGATLDKPFTKDLKETSVYPKPDDITTNGKNLIITWDYDARKDETFPLLIIYNTKNFNYIYLPIIGIIVIIAYLASIRLIKRKKEIKIKKVKVENVERYLKDEEKLIINILKQKQGQCTQATLVTLTNMSKASLSRLLNELESRNIIYKEQQGNKNLVILKRR